MRNDVHLVGTSPWAAFTQENLMLLVILPSERVTWIKEQPMDCYNRNYYRATYNSLEAVKEACLKISKCIAVADGLCDGKLFYLCKPDPRFVTRGTAGSCVYKQSRKNFPGLLELAMVRFVQNLIFSNICLNKHLFV